MATVQVVQADITTIRVDAIVNAANTGLVGGGGVDGAIHRAAGPQLDIACRRLGGCPTGEAKVTPGFELPARIIIHTPGPIWRDGSFEEPKLLRACYVNSLKRAVENHCQTVAFPSISTGVYGYPLKPAAEIALTTIRAFDAPLDVQMVCLDDPTYAVYRDVFAELTAK
ncbi:RNase III inhibitor [Secundilactobacillus paracollinoides]|uniref:RNase III inhibitor n=1 Tax=Secundilactobacillus paracollinoides TaxID=240427 RepID=A0A1B2IZ30_9LACO|nr:O-acetyl-ADP-ribose deacetylase [Secundilactobacillus paracollinoides]ANZ61348.1 RNase III inhibitor [Secundilactobacillus paracollinoides]ANZ64260.1 RNase III inhibitor [Secundilactobacillus paracollinoides]ANZ67269.1 RNase III inhibitor [Secundilactobacillus paracollinoides]KRL75399.1 Appr-1-p processing protein [Secundilactobacillus paracollinoides DSM 15502 = JCM 11969]